MKQLKNRLRSLLVLFAAVLLVSQGMFTMPVEAASGEEYLIVMQNIQVDAEKLENVPDAGKPTSEKCKDARILGIYKSSNGSITTMISNGSITDANVRTLETVDGIDSGENLTYINSPEGATLYCLTVPSASGYYCNVKNQGGQNVLTEKVGTPIKIKEGGQEDSSYNHEFYKIKNVGSIVSAEAKITGSGEYADYKNDTWSALGSQGATVYFMSNSKSNNARATTDSNSSYVINIVVHQINEADLRTITIDTDGGSNIDPITQEKGTAVTKPADPTKEGYTFDGWEPEFPSVMPDTDVTIKAKWKQNAAPVVESTITYDLKGGKLDGAKGKVTKKYANGTVITLPEPTREGYTFEYWKGSKYEAGDTYTVNGDHTFTAVWKSKGAGKGSSTKGADTGDENNLGFWIFLMSAALIGAAGMAFVKTRRR